MVDGCVTANNYFVRPTSANNYIEACFPSLQNYSPNFDFRRNYWGTVINGVETNNYAPKPNILLSQYFCGQLDSAVQVNVADLVAITRANCNPPVANCWYGLTVPGGGYAEPCTEPAVLSNNTVEKQYSDAYYLFLTEQYDQSDALFLPLSNMHHSGMTANLSGDCMQYANIARHMVDPDANFIPSANRSNGATEERANLIRPNPASESVEIGLPESGESHVTITDIFGKKVWENDCLGVCDLSLAGWSPGMYSVQIAPVGNFRPFVVKLMVSKL